MMTIMKTEKKMMMISYDVNDEKDNNDDNYDESLMTVTQ